MFSLFRFPPNQKSLIIKTKSRSGETDKWYYGNSPFFRPSVPSQGKTEYNLVWYAGRKGPPGVCGRTGATLEPLGMSIHLERASMPCQEHEVQAVHVGEGPHPGQTEPWND